VSRLGIRGWKLVLLSLVWLAALSIYVATLGLFFYFSNLLCYSDPDGSPDGEAYLSLWPPGPGCSFFFADDQPPSFAWLAVALLLLVSGAWLLRQFRRHPSDRQATRADVA
jgi:H+/Cl- antiporter ClcA